MSLSLIKIVWILLITFRGLPRPLIHPKACYLRKSYQHLDKDPSISIATMYIIDTNKPRIYTFELEDGIEFKQKVNYLKRVNKNVHQHVFFWMRSLRSEEAEGSKGTKTGF